MLQYKYGKEYCISFDHLVAKLPKYTDDVNNISQREIDDFNHNIIRNEDSQYNGNDYPNVNERVVYLWAKNMILPAISSYKQKYMNKISSTKNDKNNNHITFMKKIVIADQIEEFLNSNIFDKYTKNQINGNKKEIDFLFPLFESYAFSFSLDSQRTMYINLIEEIVLSIIGNKLIDDDNMKSYLSSIKDKNSEIVSNKMSKRMQDYLWNGDDN